MQNKETRINSLVRCLITEFPAFLHFHFLLLQINPMTMPLRVVIPFLVRCTRVLLCGRFTVYFFSVVN